MKKPFLTLLSLTLLSSAAHAQLHSHSDSFAGVKVGGTAARFLGDYALYDRYIYGFQAGFFANLALNRPFSLQPELLFSMKGSQGEIEVSDTKQELAYIDIPVPVRATYNGLFAEAGPQLGFLLTAKANTAGTKVNVRDNYRTIDFGYVFGVGYQPQTGGLGIGARYNGGFISALKPIIEGTDPLETRNSAFQVYLTYSRHHGQKARKSSKVK